MRKPQRKSTCDNVAATKSPRKHYEPTEQELAAIARFAERRRTMALMPKFKVTPGTTATTIEPDHPEVQCAIAMLADALGTGDFTLACGILDQLAQIARRGPRLTEAELNAALATIRGIAPRDPTEALLAAQMVAIHNATMVAARRLNHVETVDQQDSASNMLNKLARTFAMQLEALKRYRSTGEQKVTVQHVNVSAHQAIVGVRQGGGEGDEKANQSHAPEENRTATATDAVGPALLGQEQALGAPMPLTGRQGSKSMPHARGTSRSADG